VSRLKHAALDRVRLNVTTINLANVRRIYCNCILVSI